MTASVDTRRMAETAKTGSGRSPSGAVLPEEAADAQNIASKAQVNSKGA